MSERSNTMIDQQAIAAAIEQIDRAIKELTVISDKLSIDAFSEINFVVTPSTVLQSLNALRECAERRENKPLTLDELHQRNRKPVWIESEREGDMWSFCVTHKGYVKVIDHYGSDYGLQESDYGKRWLAYDYERSDT